MLFAGVRPMVSSSSSSGCIVPSSAVSVATMCGGSTIFCVAGAGGGSAATAAGGGGGGGGGRLGEVGRGRRGPPFRVRRRVIRVRRALDQSRRLQPFDDRIEIG